MNFNEPAIGILIMFIGIILGVILINKDLFFKKK